MKFDIKSLDIKKLKLPVLQIVMGGVIISCLVLTIPQVLNLIKVSSAAAEKKAILTEIESGINNFDAWQKDLGSLKQIYLHNMSKLPLQKEFSVFLELFSKVAKKNNVKLIAIEPQKPVDDQDMFFVRIPVYIDAACGYHDLGKFLNDLEYSSKLLRIENIRIENDGVDPLIQQVFLRIDTFCVKEKQE
ncbi:MAG: type 4a pilus biogenesis protein PilO [PVC group bacterium]|nr:type 4a pilus biogenesis protein PilO [PVC group bacterium]